jgi:hypothetical protein
MSLRAQLNDAMKEAMKAKDAKRLATVRLILAALKDRDIAARSETSRDLLGDDEILTLLAKMIKQREESATAFDTGNRPELAEGARPDGRGGDEGGGEKSDRGNRRSLDQGHGQGDGRSERTLCRSDGLFQSQRRNERRALRQIKLGGLANAVQGLAHHRGNGFHRGGLLQGDGRLVAPIGPDGRDG